MTGTAKTLEVERGNRHGIHLLRKAGPDTLKALIPVSTEGDMRLELLRLTKSTLEAQIILMVPRSDAPRIYSFYRHVNPKDQVPRMNVR